MAGCDACTVSTDAGSEVANCAVEAVWGVCA